MGVREPGTPSRRGWHLSKDLKRGVGQAFQVRGQAKPSRQECTWTIHRAWVTWALQGTVRDEGFGRELICWIICQLPIYCLLARNSPFLAGFVNSGLGPLSIFFLLDSSHWSFVNREHWNVGDRKSGEEVCGCCQQSAAKRNKIRIM